MDTLASYEELEVPPPWTGLQGHAGGKDKSCEGPGPSLDSGFFRVNKRLLFIPKAFVCGWGSCVFFDNTEIKNINCFFMFKNLNNL